jgi:hypothetical protein
MMGTSQQLPSTRITAVQLLSPQLQIRYGSTIDALKQKEDHNAPGMVARR